MSAAAPRTRIKSLHIAAESTFATDPDSDGSSYTYVPAEGAEVTDGLEVLGTEYETGRNYPTDSEIGADGGSLSFSTPVIGLSAAAGNSTNASTITDDWFDLLLLHVLGAQATTAGRNVSSSTGTSLVLASDVVGVQDIIPVYDATILTANPRSQWTHIQADAGTGTYGTVAPTWAANPTSSGIAYGVKRYTDTDAGGATLSAVARDDTRYYMMNGLRCTSAQFVGENKKRVMAKFGFNFDRKTQDSGNKTLLPVAAAVAPTPIKLFRSALYFNDTRIATKSITIDLGIAAGHVDDNESANGRADGQLISIQPTITIEPIRNDSYLAYKRAGTKGRVLAQLGAGVLSGGVLNTVAMCMDRCEAREVSSVDDRGMGRHRIVFHATDRIEFSAGVAARFFQIARA